MNINFIVPKLVFKLKENYIFGNYEPISIFDLLDQCNLIPINYDFQQIQKNVK